MESVQEAVDSLTEVVTVSSPLKSSLSVNAI
jgi:hypothetical protein